MVKKKKVMVVDGDKIRTRKGGATCVSVSTVDGETVTDDER